MKDYIKLIRMKHYVKNLLIFIPLFFGREIMKSEKLIQAFGGFICFCLISSAVYIFNDWRDREKDRNHPTKKNRPIASGRVKPRNAIILMLIFIVVAAIISIKIGNVESMLLLFLYLGLNIAYSMGLKNWPIIDIVILASGFVMRVVYGGLITDISISKWLYLVITTGSLYMGLGKRRNELKRQKNTREVLKYYNEAFLDKNMYVCVALTDVFYALWTLEMANTLISWTVPIFIVILMCYSLDIEGNSDGDPVEVILKDKILLGLVLVYGILIFGLIYIL